MTLLLIKRVPSGAKGLAATLLMAGHRWRMAVFSPQNTWSSVFYRSHTVPLWPWDVITLLCGFFQFKESERTGWPRCSLPGEDFLLHEAVCMSSMLCDNVGRVGVSEDRVNLGDCVAQRDPGLAKSHPFCPFRGILEWTVSWTCPGTKRGGAGSRRRGCRRAAPFALVDTSTSSAWRTSAGLGRTSWIS